MSKWTSEEDTWLMKNYNNKTKDEILKCINNRTWEAIKTRHNRLNNYSYRSNLYDYKFINGIKCKKCSKCEDYHPMDLNHFGKNSRRKDGFMTECKKCQGNNFNKECKDGYKICKECNKELPMTTKYFRRDNTYKNGFINICKECQGYHFTEDFSGRKEYEHRDIKDVISITNPKECVYFINKEDVIKYTKKSTNIVKMKCPYCGLEKEYSINTFFRYGFSCPVCGDKIPFGEKIVNYILKYFNCDFETQYSPEWARNVEYKNDKLSGNKKYDSYLIKYNILIEVNGRQHYEECGWGEKTFQEEHENDVLKKNLALKNGIVEKDYIVIDCKYSTLEWIKISILNSELVKLFNFNNFNWKKCYKSTIKSIKMEVCNLYNEGKSVIDISSIVGFEESTIRGWLRKLTKNGLCNYNGKYNSNNATSKMISNTKTNTDYNSISEASRLLKISRDTLRTLLNDNDNKEWIFI